MKIQNDQEPCISYSIGKSLRIAREKMDLTQQNVADRLCLKISTIQSIEDDTLSTDFSSTFLRGYIRSYARLVNIPEDSLMSTITNEQPSLYINKIKNIKNFSLKTKKNKKDTLLVILTILVFIILISVTVIWWWQNYNIPQNALTLMVKTKNHNISLHNNETSLHNNDDSNKKHITVKDNNTLQDKTLTNDSYKIPVAINDKNESIDKSIE